MWLEKVLIATWNAGPFVFGAHIIVGILLILIKKQEPRIDAFIKNKAKNPKKLEKISDFILRIANAGGWFMLVKNGLLFIVWLGIHWLPKVYQWILPYWDELWWQFFHELPSRIPGMGSPLMYR